MRHQLPLQTLAITTSQLLLEISALTECAIFIKKVIYTKLRLNYTIVGCSKPTCNLSEVYSFNKIQLALRLPHISGSPAPDPFFLIAYIHTELFVLRSEYGLY